MDFLTIVKPKPVYNNDQPESLFWSALEGGDVGNPRTPLQSAEPNNTLTRRKTRQEIREDCFQLRNSGWCDMSMSRVEEADDEERRRQRKLEEALEIKSLRRIISAYLKYACFPLASSSIENFII